MAPDDSQPPDAFQFENEVTSFEALGKENGFRHWSARELQRMLGYVDWKSFRGVINRAQNACVSADIPVSENFVGTTVVVDGQTVPDLKLSKFACYLVAMNGDPKMPGVGKAQAFFAAIAEAFQKYIQSCEDVERVDIRAQVSDRVEGLNAVAKDHGIENYAFFHDAGYRGMYNMSLSDLRTYKGASGKRPLFDFMGKRELAANLFRISETESKIANENIRGQRPLERAAETVGSDVRAMMQRQGGPSPEDLPLGTDIKKIGTDLRATHRQLKKPPETGTKSLPEST